MSDAPFFVAGLQPGNAIQVEQFNGSALLSIQVVSGVVAYGGSAHILKGEIQQSDPLADAPPLVALKVILTLSGKNTDGERILRELAAVSHVRHRYILPFIGALSTDAYTVLVSRFMENGDMLKYMTTNPETKPGPLILQVAVAVDHLHAREGLVHGDLKCENVLISLDGEAQLTDFGFSTRVEKPPEDETTGTAIRMSNTPRFAAPELLLDEAKSSTGRTRSKTPQTDVYALGMLILQAFSRARPWPDLNDHAVLLKVMQKETPPRPAVEGLGDAWWDLCQQCWNPTPEQRPSMRDVMARIRAILGVPEPDERTAHDALRDGVAPSSLIGEAKPDEASDGEVVSGGRPAEHGVQTPMCCGCFRWPWF